MKLLLTLVIVSLLSLSTYSMQAGRATGAATSSGSGAEMSSLPEIKFQDFDGKYVTGDQLKGNIIVLDFWATWCVPCIAEIPNLNQLQEKFASRGVKVIGVTMASGTVEDVMPFVAKKNMKYTVVMGDDEQGYEFNVFGFPTTFVVTKDLKIYKKYIGAGTKKAAQIEADIKKLLDQ